MYQAATYTSATMNKPPITAAIPRRRTAAPAIFGEEDAAGDRRQADEERRGGDLADGALGVPEAVVVDLAGDVAEAVVEAGCPLLAPAPATGSLEAARDQRERGAEIESATTGPALDDGLVRLPHRVPEDRLEGVGVDHALERELECGAEARCLLVPGLHELLGQSVGKLVPDGLRVQRLDRPRAEGVAVVEVVPGPVREDGHREHESCHDEQYCARHPPHRLKTVTRGA